MLALLKGSWHFPDDDDDEQEEEEEAPARRCQPRKLVVAI
jgi:hypothetical protein